ncbi:MAG TPA: undecaprenyl-diphosphatase UppP [Chloroflexota bacterium]|nr:undecaprenyl-diphosphatase UppP [Chloroflexota bacterium]
MPEVVQAVLLGVVQGLSEFLPISSTAHLALVPWALGWDSPLLNSLTFDVALHMGTLVAVLLYFWSDWLRLAVGLVGFARGQPNPGARMAGLVALGTIPAVVVGVLFQSLVETTFRSPAQIAVVLALFSLVMYGAERVAARARGLDALRTTDTVAIGCAQAVALVPGVSRSGATISTGLVLGLERAAAARFSFLLSTPVVAGAGLKKLFDLRGVAVGPGDSTLMLLGALAAGISGWLCIHWLLRYLARETMDVFVAYRLGLAAVVLALWLLRG